MNLSDLIKELEEKLLKASSPQEALSIKKDWNSIHIIPLQKNIVSALAEEKKELGRKINELKKASDELFERIKHSLERKAYEVKPLDLSVINHKLDSFSFNPLNQIKSDLIKLFSSLNFVIETGKEIVTLEENFDNLCIPESHPSRSKSETFYIDDKHILRPHCTSNSSSYLIEKAEKNKEVRLITIGCVYRRDDESSRHTHQFSQLDFVWVNKGINVGNLKWFLKTVCSYIFGEEKEYRFRNSYFPFTQPSFEMDMKCSCESSSKCSICKGTGWIEVLGAGMFRREIMEKAGFSEEYECIAGGLGLERLALIKYGITDIRNIYENNFLFLRKR